MNEWIFNAEAWGLAAIAAALFVAACILKYGLRKLAERTAPAERRDSNDGNHAEG